MENNDLKRKETQRNVICHHLLLPLAICFHSVPKIIKESQRSFVMLHTNKEEEIFEFYLNYAVKINGRDELKRSLKK